MDYILSKLKYFYLLVATILMLSVNAQTASVFSNQLDIARSPESEGISSERLSRIDAMLKNMIANNKLPGAVALIARNGKIVYHKAFGMADNTSKRKLKKDAIFRIASQTKAITSTAVMMLWEEGLFQLDDPISKYIPAFEHMEVLDSIILSDSSYTSIPAKGQITIRHLLTHTSGLGYGFLDTDSRYSKIYQKAGIVDGFTTKPISIKENVLKLAKMPLHHNPGERYTYAEGLDVLGYFVEIISGMPLDKFFKKRIFDPLQMNDTWFYLPRSKQRRLVSLQTKKNDKWVRYSSPYYDADFPIKGAKQFFSGGAGLSSTAKDYAKFLQMYLNNGEYNGISMLSRTTIQFMMANQTGDLFGDPSAYYGLAFGVISPKGYAEGGRGSIGTFEWGGYFNTMYFADPKEQLIGILMKQTMDIGADDSIWKFKHLVYGAIDD